MPHTQPIERTDILCHPFRLTGEDKSAAVRMGHGLPVVVQPRAVGEVDLRWVPSSFFRMPADSSHRVPKLGRGQKREGWVISDRVPTITQTTRSAQGGRALSPTQMGG